MQECEKFLEAGIVRQLENNGLKGGEKEQQIKLVLTYAYMAVSMYREMSPEDRILASQWHKKFRRSYSLNKFLRERQRSSRKKSFPPAPPYLDKEVQDKDEIPSLSPARVRKTLQVRQEMFWNERKMKMEVMTSWDTEYRLAAWSKRSFNKNDEAAEIRLERAKKGGGKQPDANNAELKAIAAKRAADNARLEREIKERKAGAVSYEEYLKMKKV